MKCRNFFRIACILGIALAAVAPSAVIAAPQDSKGQEPARSPAAAAYEAPSWMKAQRAEQRSQAVWRAEIRAAAAPTAAVQSRAPKKGTGGSEFLPVIGSSPHARNLGHAVVLMPQVEDPEVEALRLQALEGAAERARLQKTALGRRPKSTRARGREERQRLEEAKQSRRQDEGRLEAAQQSRRQDQSRLEAAQQSRREDESRLEAAQQSRREDEGRLEAAQAERRRQH